MPVSSALATHVTRSADLSARLGRAVAGAEPEAGVAGAGYLVATFGRLKVAR